MIMFMHTDFAEISIDHSAKNDNKMRGGKIK